MGFQNTKKVSTIHHHPPTEKNEAKRRMFQVVGSPRRARSGSCDFCRRSQCHAGTELRTEDFNKGHGQRSVHGFIDIGWFFGGLNGFKKTIDSIDHNFLKPLDSLYWWMILCVPPKLDIPSPLGMIIHKAHQSFSMENDRTWHVWWFSMVFFLSNTVGIILSTCIPLSQICTLR